MGEAKRRREILGDRYGRPTKFVPATKAQAVVAYIERNGRLLSVSRKDTGEHAAPGGKVEPGETLLLALAREVREETGLEIANAVEVYRGPHTSGREVVAFRCEAFGEPEALEEGTRVEWVSPEQIAEGFGAAYHRVALVAAGCLSTKARAADEPCETPGCILGALHPSRCTANPDNCCTACGMPCDEHTPHGSSSFGAVCTRKATEPNELEPSRPTREPSKSAPALGSVIRGVERRA